MQQGVRPTVENIMFIQGTLQSSYVTCIICGAALKRSYNAICYHLGHHREEKPNNISYIAQFFCNRRGINDRIRNLPQEDREQVIDFIMRTKERMNPVERIDGNNSLALYHGNKGRM
jgi:hypothetical protein